MCGKKIHASQLFFLLELPPVNSVMTLFSVPWARSELRLSGWSHKLPVRHLPLHYLLKLLLSLPLLPQSFSSPHPKDELTVCPLGLFLTPDFSFYLPEMSKLQLQSCFTGYIGFLSLAALGVQSVYVYIYHSGGKDSGRAMGHWSETVKYQQLNMVQPNSKVVLR